MFLLIIILASLRHNVNLEPIPNPGINHFGPMFINYNIIIGDNNADKNEKEDCVSKISPEERKEEQEDNTSKQVHITVNNALNNFMKYFGNKPKIPSSQSTKVIATETVVKPVELAGVVVSDCKENIDTPAISKDTLNQTKQITESNEGISKELNSLPILDSLNQIAKGSNIITISFITDNENKDAAGEKSKENSSIAGSNQESNLLALLCGDKSKLSQAINTDLSTDTPTSKPNKADISEDLQITDLSLSRTPPETSSKPASEEATFTIPISSLDTTTIGTVEGFNSLETSSHENFIEASTKTSLITSEFSDLEEGKDTDLLETSTNDADSFTEKSKSTLINSFITDVAAAVPEDTTISSLDTTTIGIVEGLHSLEKSSNENFIEASTKTSPITLEFSDLEEGKDIGSLETSTNDADSFTGEPQSTLINSFITDVAAAIPEDTTISSLDTTTIEIDVGLNSLETSSHENYIEASTKTSSITSEFSDLEEGKDIGSLETSTNDADSFTGEPQSTLINSFITDVAAAIPEDTTISSLDTTTIGIVVGLNSLETSSHENFIEASTKTSLITPDFSDLEEGKDIGSLETSTNDADSFPGEQQSTLINSFITDVAAAIPEDTTISSLDTTTIGIVVGLNSLETSSHENFIEASTKTSLITPDFSDLEEGKGIGSLETSTNVADSFTEEPQSTLINSLITDIAAALPEDTTNTENIMNVLDGDSDSTKTEILPSMEEESKESNLVLLPDENSLEIDTTSAEETNSLETTTIRSDKSNESREEPQSIGFHPTTMAENTESDNAQAVNDSGTENDLLQSTTTNPDDEYTKLVSVENTHPSEIPDAVTSNSIESIEEPQEMESNLPATTESTEDFGSLHSTTIGSERNFETTKPSEAEIIEYLPDEEATIIAEDSTDDSNLLTIINDETTKSPQDEMVGYLPDEESTIIVEDSTDDSNLLTIINDEITKSPENEMIGYSPDEEATIIVEDSTDGSNLLNIINEETTKPPEADIIEYLPDDEATIIAEDSTDNSNLLNIINEDTTKSQEAEIMGYLPEDSTDDSNLVTIINDETTKPPEDDIIGYLPDEEATIIAEDSTENINILTIINDDTTKPPDANHLEDMDSITHSGPISADRTFTTPIEFHDVTTMGLVEGVSSLEASIQQNDIEASTKAPIEVFSTLVSLEETTIDINASTENSDNSQYMMTDSVISEAPSPDSFEGDEETTIKNLDADTDDIMAETTPSVEGNSDESNLILLPEDNSQDKNTEDLDIPEETNTLETTTISSDNSNESTFLNPTTTPESIENPSTDSVEENLLQTTTKGPDDNSIPTFEENSPSDISNTAANNAIESTEEPQATVSNSPVTTDSMVGSTDFETESIVNVGLSTGSTPDGGEGGEAKISDNISVAETSTFMTITNSEMLLEDQAPMASSEGTGLFETITDSESNPITTTAGISTSESYVTTFPVEEGTIIAEDLAENSFLYKTTDMIRSDEGTKQPKVEDLGDADSSTTTTCIPLVTSSEPKSGETTFTAQNNLADTTTLRSLQQENDIEASTKIITEALSTPNAADLEDSVIGAVLGGEENNSIETTVVNIDNSSEDSQSTLISGSTITVGIESDTEITTNALDESTDSKIAGEANSKESNLPSLSHDNSLEESGKEPTISTKDIISLETTTTCSENSNKSTHVEDIATGSFDDNESTPDIKEIDAEDTTTSTVDDNDEIPSTAFGPSDNSDTTQEGFSTVSLTDTSDTKIGANELVESIFSLVTPTSAENLPESSPSLSTEHNSKESNTPGLISESNTESNAQGEDTSSSDNIDTVPNESIESIEEPEIVTIDATESDTKEELQNAVADSTPRSDQAKTKTTVEETSTFEGDENMSSSTTVDTDAETETLNLAVNIDSTEVATEDSVNDSAKDIDSLRSTTIDPDNNSESKEDLQNVAADSASGTSGDETETIVNGPVAEISSLDTIMGDENTSTTIVDTEMETLNSAINIASTEIATEGAVEDIGSLQSTTIGADNNPESKEGFQNVAGDSTPGTNQVETKTTAEDTSTLADENTSSLAVNTEAETLNTALNIVSTEIATEDAVNDSVDDIGLLQSSTIGPDNNSESLLQNVVVDSASDTDQLETEATVQDTSSLAAVYGDENSSSTAVDTESETLNSVVNLASTEVSTEGSVNDSVGSLQSTNIGPDNNSESKEPLNTVNGSVEETSSFATAAGDEIPISAAADTETTETAITAENTNLSTTTEMITSDGGTAVPDTNDIEVRDAGVSTTTLCVPVVTSTESTLMERNEGTTFVNPILLPETTTFDSLNPPITSQDNIEVTTESPTGGADDIAAAKDTLASGETNDKDTIQIDDISSLDATTITPDKSNEEPVNNLEIIIDSPSDVNESETEEAVNQSVEDISSLQYTTIRPEDNNLEDLQNAKFSTVPPLNSNEEMGSLITTTNEILNENLPSSRGSSKESNLPLLLNDGSPLSDSNSEEANIPVEDTGSAEIESSRLTTDLILDSNGSNIGSSVEGELGNPSGGEKLNDNSRSMEDIIEGSNVPSFPFKNSDIIITNSQESGGIVENTGSQEAATVGKDNSLQFTDEPQSVDLDSSTTGAEIPKSREIDSEPGLLLNDMNANSRSSETNSKEGEGFEPLDITTIDSDYYYEPTDEQQSDKIVINVDRSVEGGDDNEPGVGDLSVPKVEGNTNDKDNISFPAHPIIMDKFEDLNKVVHPVIAIEGSDIYTTHPTLISVEEIKDGNAEEIKDIMNNEDALEIITEESNVLEAADGSAEEATIINIEEDGYNNFDESLSSELNKESNNQSGDELINVNTSSEEPQPENLDSSTIENDAEIKIDELVEPGLLLNNINKEAALSETNSKELNAIFEDITTIGPDYITGIDIAEHFPFKPKESTSLVPIIMNGVTPAGGANKDKPVKKPVGLPAHPVIIDKFEDLNAVAGTVTVIDDSTETTTSPTLINVNIDEILDSEEILVDSNAEEIKNIIIDTVSEERITEDSVLLEAGDSSVDNDAEGVIAVNIEGDSPNKLDESLANVLIKESYEQSSERIAELYTSNAENDNVLQPRDTTTILDDSLVSIPIEESNEQSIGELIISSAENDNKLELEELEENNPNILDESLVGVPIKDSREDSNGQSSERIAELNTSSNENDNKLQPEELEHDNPNKLEIDDGFVDYDIEGAAIVNIEEEEPNKFDESLTNVLIKESIEESNKQSMEQTEELNIILEEKYNELQSKDLDSSTIIAMVEDISALDVTTISPDYYFAPTEEPQPDNNESNSGPNVNRFPEETGNNKPEESNDYNDSSGRNSDEIIESWVPFEESDNIDVEIVTMVAEDAEFITSNPILMNEVTSVEGNSIDKNYKVAETPVGIPSHPVIIDKFEDLNAITGTVTVIDDSIEITTIPALVNIDEILEESNSVEILVDSNTEDNKNIIIDAVAEERITEESVLLAADITSTDSDVEAVTVIIEEDGPYKLDESLANVLIKESGEEANEQSREQLEELNIVLEEKDTEPQFEDAHSATITSANDVIHALDLTTISSDSYFRLTEESQPDSQDNKESNVNQFPEDTANNNLEDTIDGNSSSGRNDVIDVNADILNSQIRDDSVETNSERAVNLLHEDSSLSTTTRIDSKEKVNNGVISPNLDDNGETYPLPVETFKEPNSLVPTVMNGVTSAEESSVGKNDKVVQTPVGFPAHPVIIDKFEDLNAITGPVTVIGDSTETTTSPILLNIDESLEDYNSEEISVDSEAEEIIINADAEERISEESAIAETTEGFVETTIVNIKEGNPNIEAASIDNNLLESNSDAIIEQSPMGGDYSTENIIIKEIVTIASEHEELTSKMTTICNPTVTDREDIVTHGNEETTVIAPDELYGSTAIEAIEDILDQASDDNYIEAVADPKDNNLNSQVGGPKPLVSEEFNTERAVNSISEDSSLLTTNPLVAKEVNTDIASVDAVVETIKIKPNLPTGMESGEKFPLSEETFKEASSLVPIVMNGVTSASFGDVDETIKTKPNLPTGMESGEKVPLPEETFKETSSLVPIVMNGVTSTSFGGVDETIKIKPNLPTGMESGEKFPLSEETFKEASTLVPIVMNGVTSASFGGVDETIKTKPNLPTGMESGEKFPLPEETFKETSSLVPTVMNGVTSIEGISRGKPDQLVKTPIAIPAHPVIIDKFEDLNIIPGTVAAVGDSTTTGTAADIKIEDDINNQEIITKESLLEVVDNSSEQEYTTVNIEEERPKQFDDSLASNPIKESSEQFNKQSNEILTEGSRLFEENKESSNSLISTTPGVMMNNEYETLIEENEDASSYLTAGDIENNNDNTVFNDNKNLSNSLISATPSAIINNEDDNLDEANDASSSLIRTTAGVIISNKDETFEENEKISNSLMSTTGDIMKDTLFEENEDDSNYLISTTPSVIVNNEDTTLFENADASNSLISTSPGVIINNEGTTGFEENEDDLNSLRSTNPSVILNNQDETLFEENEDGLNSLLRTTPSVIINNEDETLLEESEDASSSLIRTTVGVINNNIDDTLFENENVSNYLISTTTGVIINEDNEDASNSLISTTPGVIINNQNKTSLEENEDASNSLMSTTPSVMMNNKDETSFDENDDALNSLITTTPSVIINNEDETLLEEKDDGSSSLIRTTVGIISNNNDESLFEENENVSNSLISTTPGVVTNNKDNTSFEENEGASNTLISTTSDVITNDKENTSFEENEDASNTLIITTPAVNMNNEDDTSLEEKEDASNTVMSTTPSVIINNEDDTSFEENKDASNTLLISTSPGVTINNEDNTFEEKEDASSSLISTTPGIIINTDIVEGVSETTLPAENPGDNTVKTIAETETITEFGKESDGDGIPLEDLSQTGLTTKMAVPFYDEEVILENVGLIPVVTTEASSLLASPFTIPRQPNEMFTVANIDTTSSSITIPANKREFKEDTGLTETYVTTNMYEDTAPKVTKFEGDDTGIGNTEAKMMPTVGNIDPSSSVMPLPVSKEEYREDTALLETTATTNIDEGTVALENEVTTRMASSRAKMREKNRINSLISARVKLPRVIKNQFSSVISSRVETLDKVFNSKIYRTRTKPARGKPRKDSEYMRGKPKRDSQVMRDTPRRGSQVIRDNPRRGSQVMRDNPRRGSQGVRDNPRRGSQGVRDNPRRGSQGVRDNPRRGSQDMRGNPLRVSQVLRSNPKRGSQDIRGGPRRVSQVLRENPRRSSNVKRGKPNRGSRVNGGETKRGLNFNVALGSNMNRFR